MQTVLVASSKGGAGKTTLATGLAAAYAVAGKRTVLLDVDPQRSALHWCERRAPQPAAVLGIEGNLRRWPRELPADVQRLIIDTPAGAMAADLGVWLDQVDAVLVPVAPSYIDLEASVPFLNSLAQHPRVRKRGLAVGLVANRLRPWTSASRQALEQLALWPYPLVAQLRDSQSHVLLAGLGKSLFDYHSEQVLSHQQDWAPLLRWLQTVTANRRPGA